jgi:hypothetical protein
MWNVTLRDEIEAVIRGWNRYEVSRGLAPIFDFDLAPGRAETRPAADRLQVHRRLGELAREAADAGEPHLLARVRADRAYLGALLGEHPPLDEYVRATQGCPALGWPRDHVEARLEAVRARLDKLGIGWDRDTETALRECEGPLPAADAPGAIRAAAAAFEPAVRRLTGTSAPYELDVEEVDLDVYWSYWLDGAGSRVRLRLNLRNAAFTQVRVRQFALHEVLGHGLQCASLARRAAAEDVPWVRLMSVHGPTQVLLEGLAQTLPLFVAPDDELLVTRVLLDSYLQLVRAELHLAVDAGAGVARSAEHARSRVPFWSDAHIGDLLADRGANPLLRSYLWAYPAGFEWFTELAGAAPEVVSAVLRAAYREPLGPAGLAGLWPAGPPIGGPGGPVLTAS